MKEILQALADALADDEDLDDYGSGTYLANFEFEIVALFGTETAVLMPTGTMAQQIALRIWCEQRRNLASPCTLRLTPSLPSTVGTDFCTISLAGIHAAGRLC